MFKRSFVHALAIMVTRRPAWVISSSLIIIMLLSAGTLRLGFKSDYRVFFSPENPQLLAFNEIQDTFNKSDNVLFIMEPKNGDIFNPTTLKAIHALTKKSWQIPFSNRVDSITNFQHTSAAGDDLAIADLVDDPTQLTDKKIAFIKKTALNEPLLVNRLISATGHVTGVNVTVQLPDIHPMEAMEVAAAARALAKEIETNYPSIKLHLTGIVMINNAFIESPIQDISILFPLMFVIVTLALFLCLGSFIATVSVLFLIVLSIVPALGLFGWQGSVLTQASAPAPIMILTMAVADCVHLLTTALHFMRVGHEKSQAIQQSLKINFQPMLLTSATTAIGFLSLNFSDAPPYRDLGNIVAMGVAIAFIMSVSFLPALLSLLPVKVKITEELDNTLMKRLASFVIRRRKVLFAVNGLAAICMIAFVPMNEMNDELVKYFDDTTSIRQATDFLDRNMSGIYTIEFVMHADSEGGINEPSFLNKVELFSEWLRQQPEIVHVNSITDTLKRLNKNMHGDNPTRYKLPESRELAAQYLLMYEMSLPYGLDLNDQVNVDKSSTRIIVTMHNMSSNQMLDIEARSRAWLHNNIPEFKTTIASPALMFSHIGKRNIVSLVIGAFIALTLISVILVVAFRSIKLGLISLIPNLIPAGISFGIWGLIDGQINLGVSIVAGMTLGIIVDDTVHFISKYRFARTEKGLSPEGAVLYSFSTVGNAIWITSAVLISGFMILNLSNFTVNSDMGLLTAITITVALLMDLLFLPPILMLIDKSKQ